MRNRHHVEQRVLTTTMAQQKSKETPHTTLYSFYPVEMANRATQQATSLANKPMLRTQTVQGGGWSSSKGGDLQIDARSMAQPCMLWKGRMEGAQDIWDM